jgi:hypothetical protein
MVPDKSVQHHSPRRGTVDVEEQRAWVGFYKRVGRDPVLATEVMAELDGDAEFKRRHLALYLSCKQAVRLHQARQARDKRIGQGLRVLAQVMLVRPVALTVDAVRHALQRGADLLAEAVTSARVTDASPKRTGRATGQHASPPADGTPEPASDRVSALVQEAEFEESHARFLQQSGMSPVASHEHGVEAAAERRTAARQAGHR